MNRVTITKVEQDPRGFWTARVSDGHDTITVDNRIGPWTTPVDESGAHDPHADHGSNQLRRRELYPEVTARLRSRVRAAARGEAQDESDVTLSPRLTIHPVKPAATTPKKTTIESIAQRMAEAGAAAIKEAA